MSGDGRMRSKEEIEKKLKELKEDRKRISYGINHCAIRHGQIGALEWVLNNRELLLAGI